MLITSNPCFKVDSNMTIFFNIEAWFLGNFFPYQSLRVLTYERGTATSDMCVFVHPWGHYNFQHFKEEKKYNCFYSIWWKLKHKTKLGYIRLKCLERQKKEWVMHTHWLHRRPVYMRHRPWPSFPSKGSRPLKAGRHFCIKEDVPHFSSSCWALAQ